MRSEAARQEEEPDDGLAAMGEAGGNDAESMLQSKSNAVVTINSMGVIEMVNKPAYVLFG